MVKHDCQGIPFRAKDEQLFVMLLLQLSQMNK